MGHIAPRLPVGTQVESWRFGLQAELDHALDHTPLPAAPDVDRVDSWLRSVRRRSL